MEVLEVQTAPAAEDQAVVVAAHLADHLDFHHLVMTEFLMEPDAEDPETL